MIEDLEIDLLRGVRHGELAGFAPLTIITGPNGSAKSTVLEALLLASSPDPADAVGRVVGRRRETWDASRWLVHGGGTENSAAAQISVTDSTGSRYTRRFEWHRSPEHDIRDQLGHAHLPQPWSEVRCLVSVSPDTEVLRSRTAFGVTNQYLPFPGPPAHPDAPPETDFVRLVDTAVPIPLDRTFSRVQHFPDRREALTELLSMALPKSAGTEILLEEDQKPVLYLHYKAEPSVPVALAGDGVQALMRILLELAAVPRGLVLFEEPEVHQHPAALDASARAIVAGAARGLQIILTTHSLELVERLLGAVGEVESLPLDDIAAFNLWLEEGHLRCRRRSGDEARFALVELDEDLR